ncbi:MAG: hypothetical protein N2652_00350 [Kiritimatiellae bacterium]|nr:hypothetical protein [Kiritimatiellia bacterium]
MTTPSLRPVIDSFRQARLHVVRLSAGGLPRFFATDAPGGNGGPEPLAREIGEFLAATGATVAAMDLFGPCELEAKTLDLLRRYCGRLDWPITWIDGSACAGHAPVAAQFYAVGGSCEPIFFEGRRVGTLIEDDDARYAILVGLLPADLHARRGDQARSVFERMDAALAPVGMDFYHIVRTWLYCDRILDWYNELNRVRNAFFAERGVYDRLVPASTGVGTANPYGAALVGEALAIQPKRGDVSIRSLPSPLQCPAPAYGSSFSRAVEVRLPSYRRLYVSGTASIHPNGETAHVGDVDAQVELTMRVVEAIMEQSAYRWADVNRAIAYFKHAADASAWDRWCARHRLQGLPIVVVKADICRDDLLFEIEVDALAIG